MKIVFPLAALQVLAGHLRAMLSIADCCKLLGHEVTLLGDSMSILQGPDPEVKPNVYYPLDKIREYHPLKALTHEDAKFVELFSLKARPFYEEADLVWSFGGYCDNLEFHIDNENPNLIPPRIVLKNHWVYEHWPVPEQFPWFGARIFANSSYTAEAVKKTYGRDAEVLWPPVPLDRYDPMPSFEERDIDLVFLGRVNPAKLDNPPLINSVKGLKVLIVGSDSPNVYPGFKAEPTWIKNATFEQVREALSHSKVYVHWQGLGKAGFEHYGITIAEAMASGVVCVLPKGGGAWFDISEKGKHCVGADSPEQAIKRVKKLCKDKELWNEWHSRAIKRLGKLGYGTAMEKISESMKELS